MKKTTLTWGEVREAWSCRHEPERLRELVEVYWRVLLVSAGILIVCAALYGAFKLFSALEEGGNEMMASSNDSGFVISRAELQETLEGFGARKERYELLKSSPPAIADPSR